ncbi:MAG TPA: DUF3572 family protein [Aestuariivirgaceae bacterium]|jgi:hypothetical protein
MPKLSLSPDAAAAIALRALAFLAKDPKRISRFLDLTGTDPSTIATLATQTDFQKAVLDHLLSEESMLLEFCTNESIDPTLPSKASEILSSSR